MNTKEINEALCGYMGSILMRVSSSKLHASDTAKARLATIYGWIAGLSMSEQHLPLAEKIAADLDEDLEYLENFGGEVEIGGKMFPKFRVVLSDDDTLHGLGLAWFHVTTECEDSNYDLALERYNAETKTYAMAYYKYAFNGAMIYRGPVYVRKEAFAVSLDNRDCMWSIHT